MIEIFTKLNIDKSQYDLTGKFIKKFRSIAEAQRIIGIKTIRSCLLFNRKSTGGFVWRYKNVIK